MGKHKRRPFQCGICHHHFQSLHDAETHARAKHRADRTPIYQRVATVEPRGAGREASMAEVAIDAQVRAACGESLNETDRILLESINP